MAGFAAIVLIIVCGGHAGPVAGTWPLSRWFGLLNVPSAGWSDRSGARLLLIAVTVLALAWLVIHRAARARRLSLSAVAGVAAGWSVPLLVAPPLFSGDLYSYTAQGLLQWQGMDPYRVGPSALGPTSALSAVDPRWQDVPAPYGPLALLVERAAAAVSGGGAVATLVTLRLIMQLALLGCAVVAVRAVAVGERPAVLSYVLLSPLIVLQVSSAGHLESLLMLGILGAVVAAQRQCWTVAIAAATAAFAIKASVLPAVVAICWFHATQVSVHRERLRVVRSDLIIALATYGVVALIVPDNWGWVRSLSTPGQSVTADAPTTIVVRLLTDLPGAIALRTDPTILTVGRILGMLLAAAIGCGLIVTHRSRPLAATVGYALLAVGLLGPVLYPWYLLWGIAPLILRAGRHHRMLTLMMCMGPLLEIPGLTGVRNTALGFGAAAILVLAERLTSFPPSREFADPRMGNGPAQMEYYRTVVV
ncbi:MAG TPA: polyprenol phosphomannose-dependent alpha 1,6 mannosyltransferase MptB [Mycobacteriales bacterium]|nr:polyprenol phosphomannose-dependent alpha 1,6 mannosyltransferase MptB [Mycobacteriales bacterium]